MKIAIIAWGSLIWDPAKLTVVKSLGQNGWFPDGPDLPIEFARISNNGRLTLVINSKSEKLKTLFAISNCKKLDEAILDLAVRESCGKNKIGRFIKKNSECFPHDFHFKNEIEIWIKNKEVIDAVIWTNLKSNFKNITDREFNEENVLNYLKYLKADTQVLAEEYIRRTPTQIKTKMRKSIEKNFKWLAMS